MTETINQEYIELPKPDNLGEMLNVVSNAWLVKGPIGGHHLFQFIQCAEVMTWGIAHQNIIRHYHDGDLRDDIKWGHDACYAYQSCKFEQKSYNKPSYEVGLLANHIFKSELPCCGGRFTFIKERTGYCCIVFGMCQHCKAAWSVTDGGFWVRED